MGQIEELRAFVKIVEFKSIGKAASALGISKSSISRRLKLIEDRLNTTLVKRDTRTWQLTDAGQRYYHQGIDILSEFDTIESELRKESNRLSGSIRIASSCAIANSILVKPLVEFAKNNPDVKLFCDISDRSENEYSEKFDVYIRAGRLPDSSMIARKIFQENLLLCASTRYLENANELAHPTQLEDHNVIRFGDTKTPVWSFLDPDGKVVKVRLKPSFDTFDDLLCLAAANEGLGIALLSETLAEESLQNGSLVKVLPKYQALPKDFYIVYSPTKHLPKRTRALIDYLSQMVRAGKR